MDRRLASLFFGLLLWLSPGVSRASADFATLHLDTLVAAPVERVWQSYVSLNPNVRLARGTLHVDRIREGDQAYDPDTEWSGLKEGQRFEASLSLLGLAQPVDLELTRLDAPDRVVYRYGDRALVDGELRVTFTEVDRPEGGTATMVRHSVRYRGRNFFYQLIYPSVHRAIWVPFYSHLKAEMERG